MVDFTGNPYLTDPRFQLSDDQMRQYRLGSLGSALTNLGAGIAGAGASGQPWMAGIAPGAAMASQAMGQEQARLAQMQEAAAKWAQMEDYRKSQQAHLDLETEAQRRMFGFQDKMLGPGGIFSGGVPGGGIQAPPAPLMTPPGGVNDNNIGNVRPPGASKGFQQPPDFDSGVGLTVSNARAYPSTYNGGKPMTLAQIGAHWAPVGSADDPTGLNKNWVPNVAKLSGLDPNMPLDLNNPQVAVAFARGVHGAEKGPQAMRSPEAYLPGVAKGLPSFAPAGIPGQFGSPSQMVAQAGGPPVIPQGGDAAQGQPGTIPQPPQGGPQMPPGMPGPPPDTSPYAAAALGGPQFGAMGAALGANVQKQYEYQWKAYQAAQEAAKQAQERANAGVQIGSDGQPILNPMVPQAEALKAGAVERSKLAPDITQGQARAAGEKALAEEQAKSTAKMNTYFPPGMENKSPEDKLAMLPPNVRGVVQDFGKGDLAFDELPGRMASSGIDPSKVDIYSLTKDVYGDKFDMREGQNRKNFLTNIYEQNKPEGATRLALITGGQHLATFAQLVKAQTNGDYPLLNSIVKQWNDQTGSPKFSGADALMQFLAPEAAKVVKGGGALNEKEVEDNKATLMTTKSWPQANEILNTWMGAMLARKNGLEETGRSLGVPDAKLSKIWGTGPNGSPSSFNKAIQSLAETTGRAPETGGAPATIPDKNASMQPKSNAANPPKITTKADFDKLKSGDLFEAPNGVIKVKP